MLVKEKVINKVWIDKEFKKIYFNGSENGLRMKFSEYIVQELREKIIDFIKFLRRRYYFPIRCTIFIKSNNEFFEKENSTKKLLEIFIITKIILKKIHLFGLQLVNITMFQSIKKILK
ncbi:hypothetical protein A8G01_00025 [Acholeplasma laidlawii]|nr:hypothetical protein A9269_04730 [Acholeplasma laidlawii]OWU87734.1 hypothetical protein A8G01_00025 [Acholeplasma laidlawii]